MTECATCSHPCADHDAWGCVACSCSDCGATVDCWDGDYSTVLEVHAAQECEGPACVWVESGGMCAWPDFRRGVRVVEAHEVCTRHVGALEHHTRLVRHEASDPRCRWYDTDLEAVRGIACEVCT